MKLYIAYMYNRTECYIATHIDTMNVYFIQSQAIKHTNKPT